MTVQANNTLVIGIGESRGGDASVGLEVARRLRARHPEGVIVIERRGDAASLLEAWLDRRWVILVDATFGGHCPGSIQRFEAHRQPLPARTLHACRGSWGVAEAVEMARELGQMPGSLIVYGIEGRSSGPGPWLSPEVAAVVDEAVQQILTEVGAVVSA